MAIPKKSPVTSMVPKVSLNPDSTPIMYTDNVIISSNEDGIVLDFCQRLGGSSQVRIVSRMGMSKSHARKLLMVLKGQIDRDKGHVQTGKKVVN